MLGGFWRRKAPEWGIVMLAREPAALVLTHLAWHLAAGSREVHLFLDEPDDPVAEAAASLPGVQVTRCDAAFWANHPSGRRPGLIVTRQVHCATLAYGRAGVDWLLHLDADEFLLQTTPLERELARHRNHPGALLVPVRERVHENPHPQTLFEGLFRTPVPKPDRDHPLLQPLADMAPAGVIGHSLGKSLTRTGLEVDLHPHFPRPRGGGRPDAVPRLPCRSAVLLHFDGLTPLHWLAKMLRRVPTIASAPAGYLGAHRRAQLAAVEACGRDPGALGALHDRLRVLPDPAPFLAAGLVERHGFDPAPACRQVLGHVPDLSVAGFDAALRAAEPELLAGV
jgi:hypothetical protein